MIKSFLKTSWRSIFRNKTYSFINILGLSFGLAACWLIVLYVADELSYDRYHVNADRVVRVVQHTRWNGNDLHQAPTSAPFAPALKAAFPEVERAARIDIEGGGVISYNGKSFKQNDIVFADQELLDIFSYDFLFGSPADALSKPQAIIINETLAKKIFGSAEKAYNQTLYFENKFPNTVTGIIRDIPVHSHLRFSAVRSLPAGFAEGWQNFHVYTYLLLKKGVRYQDLEKKLPKFAAGTIQKIMKVPDYRMELQPLTSIHLHSDLEYEMSPNGSISRVYMFSAIAALILVIALINYMNLSTVRSSSRVREIGVRKVVGSDRKNVAALFITEAVLLTGIAAFFAFCIVKISLPFFDEIASKELSIWRFGVVNTLAAATVFSLITGMLAGIYPSLLLAKFKAIPALKGQMGDLSASIAFRKSLVIFQFVISVVMISGSVIIYQQLDYALHTDLGFNKDQVLTFHIDDRKVRTQLPALKNQLLQSPLVEGVAAAGNPIGNNDLGGMGYYFQNEDGEFSTSSVMAQELVVDADYVPTLDIKLVTGRNFSDANKSDQFGGALVNETLVKKVGWKNAVGKTIRFRVEDTMVLERTVIGVVKDFNTYSLQHTISPLVMVMPPVESMKDNLYVKLASGNIQQGLAYLDRIYKKYDPSNKVEYNFLNQNFARQYESEERQGKIALMFTVLAVLIACLGLFGLAAFTTAQRKKEIGVRKVLGASVLNIVHILSIDFLKLVALAAVISSPVAWFLMKKWLEDFAYRIDISWTVFMFSAVLAALIALLTVSFQALRAAVANPVKSLKTE